MMFELKALAEITLLMEGPQPAFSFSHIWRKKAVVFVVVVVVVVVVVS